MTVEHPNRLESYYRNVYKTYFPVSPDLLPTLGIDRVLRQSLLQEVGKKPEDDLPSAIRAIALKHLFGDASPIKLGVIPTAEFNTRVPVPDESGWNNDTDVYRESRDAHPACNTLVLAFRPELGPYCIAQEGFTVTSPKYPHVEVVRYEIVLVSLNQDPDDLLSGIRMAGTRMGYPHEHFTDAFGDWCRSNLQPEQILRAQLPKFSRTNEFRLPKPYEVSRLATLLTMCLEQNQLKYPIAVL
ncbi:MAG: hypothetical protein NUV65_05265 [Candidatus Roizmanbacteria bacterium]|nr:hypothetical protein [Candidatus Roizmanbacteria bacterium]